MMKEITPERVPGQKRIMQTPIDVTAQIKRLRKNTTTQALGVKYFEMIHKK